MGVFTNLNEKDFLYKLKNGDEKTIKQFYIESYPFICQYVTKQGLSLADGQDIAARILHDVIDKAPMFKSFDHLEAHLIKSAKNDCINLRQKNQHLLERQYEFIANQLPDQNEYLNKISEQEFYKQVRTAVQKLPKQQRKIIEMYFFEDKSNEEIAAALNISSNTVKTHKHRAFETLRHNLPPEIYQILLALLPFLQ